MDVAIAIITACSGFLIAVLWMDLIFDVQVLAHRGATELPESVLASIANYYHRATTTARPMGHLIAVVMVILLITLGFRTASGQDPVWVIAISIPLALVPVVLALLRTVPNAMRLGKRKDPAGEQSRLARIICVDHLVFLGGKAIFLALWLSVAAWA